MLALLDSAGQLTSELSLAALLDNLLVVAGRISRAEAASVILHDPLRHDLYFAAATGPAADQVRNMRIPEGPDSIAGAVFATSASRLENRVTNHYKAVDDETAFDTKSLICVPLSFANEKLGVLQLLNKAAGNEPFTEADLDLARHLADQAAIAIRNAELFGRVIASSGLYGAPSACGDLVRRFVLNEGAATVERVTVLFADLRGSTRFAEILGDASRIHARLNEFLALLIDKVYAAGGIVNKMLGDGIMGFFRDEASASRALQCSFEIIAGFARLHEGWAQKVNQDISFLDVGVGISTDDVVLGPTGNERLRDLTVIGGAVNLAAALEYHARSGRRILCDNLTFHEARDIIASSCKLEAFRVARPEQVTGLSYTIHEIKALRNGHDDVLTANSVDGKPVTSFTKRAKVFISYSRHDSEWRDRFSVFLKPLVREGLVDYWCDENVEAGTLWQDDLHRALSGARVIVLLISADFFASDFIARQELPTILSTAQDHGARILPIVISPSAYQRSPLSIFQTVNPPSQPLAAMSKTEQDAVFDKVMRAIESELK
ncbi:MAG: GAF domain-containing protein [Candidatus Eremiobacteraeota bacterium]|nr:GAF domain-containing protein [Candidatus Eremiobacteraeota bacterium]